MYSNDSFGGANRGPASMRPPRRRSNLFVDLGFIALIIGCVGIVGYQYYPMLTTTGYNVAAGHVDRVDYLWGYNNYGYNSYSYRSSRRESYFDFLKTDFSYKTDGKTYHASSISVPLVTLLSLDLLMLGARTNKSGLAVRYDQANPQICVPVEVIDAYTHSAMITYVCVFVVCFILLILAGMANLSGEKWNPFKSSDVY